MRASATVYRKSVTPKAGVTIDRTACISSDDVMKLSMYFFDLANHMENPETFKMPEDVYSE